MTQPAAPLQPLLEAHSLRPSDSQAALAGLLVADGSRCWVPVKQAFYTYHAASVASPDGNTTIAGLGGGNWIVDATNSAKDSSGTTAILAASTSAYLDYNAGDPGFGTLVPLNNSAPVAAANRQAIQAAINAGLNDSGRRGAVIPRVSGSHTILYTDQPLIICDQNAAAGGVPFRLRGEHRGVTLETLFQGYAIVGSAPVTAPTPTQHGNFWMFPLNAGFYIFFDNIPSMSLNGLSAFSIQFPLWLNGTSNNTVIMAWSGTHLHGISPTTALEVFLDNSGRLSANFTNTTAHTGSVIGTTVLSTGTFYWCEVNFDGTNWRVFINGTQDAITTLGAADTISQGYETICLGGQASTWPMGTPFTIATNGLVGQLQIYDHVPSGHTTTYVPPTSPISSTVDGTMMLLDFSPQTATGGTVAVNAVGSIVGQVQKGSAGAAGNAWLLLTDPAQANQGTPIYTEDLATTSAIGNAGIFIQLSPNSRIKRVDGGQITLYNNSYLAQLEDMILTLSTTYGLLKTPKVWGFFQNMGGPNRIVSPQIAGGDVCMVMLNGGGRVEKPDLIPAGDFQMIIRQEGVLSLWEIDAFYGGDESGQTSQACIAFSSAFGPSSLGATGVFTQGSTSITGVTHDLSATIPAGCSFYAGGQAGVLYTVASITSNSITTTVPFTGSSGTYTIQNPQSPFSIFAYIRGQGQILNQAANGLFWIDGGSDYVFENIPWTAAQNGSTIFRFINPPDGAVVVRGGQVTSSSQGSQSQWMPSTGNAGQGLIRVENQQDRLRKYACPDTAYTLLPNEFTWRHIAPVGALGSTHIHTLPLIAGYEWVVDNTFQTGTPQSVTYKCLSDPGSGVTVAAGKRATIACYDTSVGLVRITPDT